jgi:hypothetical protein
LIEDLIHDLTSQVGVLRELAELTLGLEELVEYELNVAPGCRVLSHIRLADSDVWAPSNASLLR